MLSFDAFFNNISFFIFNKYYMFILNGFNQYLSLRIQIIIMIYRNLTYFGKNITEFPTNEQFIINYNILNIFEL